MNPKPVKNSINKRAVADKVNWTLNFFTILTNYLMMQRIKCAAISSKVISQQGFWLVKVGWVTTPDFTTNQSLFQWQIHFRCGKGRTPLCTRGLHCFKFTELQLSVKMHCQLGVQTKRVFLWQHSQVIMSLGFI